MKISIVTPSFNQGKYIDQTIKSVLHQRGDFELEYIIIDGKSTDNTLDIIKKHANRDNRLKWISEPDTGQSEAINKGLRIATGEIIGWLNSDDIYQPGCLKLVVEKFREKQEINWITGYCNIINEKNEVIRKFITKYKNIWLKYYYFNNLLILNFISQPATFWRKKIVSDVGYLSEHQHLSMDYEYWLKIGCKNLLHVIPSYLADFRVSQDNKSSMNFKKQLKEEYQIANNFIKNKWWLRYFHWIHFNLIIFIYNFIIQ
ncbi:MAG: glycosyltransferase family 2 protein [Patescibacteria group bacterium]